MTETYIPQEPVRNDDVYPEWNIRPVTSFMSAQPGVSRLSTEQLSNKIKGLIYGIIAADNYATHELRSRQGNNLTWGFGAQQALLALDGLIRNGGLVVPTDFSARLRFWARCGFPELNDQPVGMSPAIQTKVHVSRALPTSNEFVDFPARTAQKIWELTGRQEALNACVARTGVVGAVQFWDVKKVFENAVALCKTTHADPRCVASCIAVSAAVALLLSGRENIRDLIDEAFTWGGRCLGADEASLKEFGKYAGVTDLSVLNLGDPASADYTYKAMSAGFAVLQTASDFASGINSIVQQKGDPETAAVAGALLGCRFGYDSIPVDWVKMLPHRELIDVRVERFLGELGLSPLERVQ
jgi:ADP-ribosylglycohydrolase